MGRQGVWGLLQGVMWWVLVVVGGGGGVGEGQLTKKQFDEINTPRQLPRRCDPIKEFQCEQNYMRCILYRGPANDPPTACMCAAEFYGMCLREAGCASDRMLDCIDEHMIQDCADMSVCGSNCIGSGDAYDIKDQARILPVNNFGANYIQFSVCNLGMDEDILSRFETVRMRRCDTNTFKICPYWIPPRTLTAVAIPKNSTYIKMERAVYIDSRMVSDWNISWPHDEFIADILRDPPPKEYYGTEEMWPSTIDIEFADTHFCATDEQCPGSYCDRSHVPRKCAPKSIKHFMRSGAEFMSPSFSDDV